MAHGLGLVLAAKREGLSSVFDRGTKLVWSVNAPNELAANQLVTNAADATSWSGSCRAECFVRWNQDRLRNTRFEGAADCAAVIIDDREQHERGDEYDEGKLVAPSRGDAEPGGVGGGGDRGAKDGKKCDVSEGAFNGDFVHAIYYASCVPTDLLYFKSFFYSNLRLINFRTLEKDADLQAALGSLNPIFETPRLRD